MAGKIWEGFIVALGKSPVVLLSAKTTGSIVPQNKMADIRPELLRDVIHHGRFHLRSPVSGGLPQTALLRRIISVG